MINQPENTNPIEIISIGFFLNKKDTYLHREYISTKVFLTEIELTEMRK